MGIVGLLPLIHLGYKNLFIVQIVNLLPLIYLGYKKLFVELSYHSIVLCKFTTFDLSRL